jgi:glycogen synthase
MYFCAVLKLQYGTVPTADAVGGIQFTVDNVHPRGC